MILPKNVMNKMLPAKLQSNENSLHLLQHKIHQTLCRRDKPRYLFLFFSFLFFTEKVATENIVRKTNHNYGTWQHQCMQSVSLKLICVAVNVCRHYNPNLTILLFFFFYEQTYHIAIYRDSLHIIRYKGVLILICAHKGRVLEQSNHP